MKNISFALTTTAFLTRSKLVTRRLGWRNLTPGEHLMGCEKCQGIPKGESIKHLGEIIITGHRLEPLKSITQDEVILEGFPELEPQDFIDLFCQTHKDCTPKTELSRIAFDYVSEPTWIRTADYLPAYDYPVWILDANNQPIIGTRTSLDDETDFWNTCADSPVIDPLGLYMCNDVYIEDIEPTMWKPLTRAPLEFLTP